MRRQAWQLPATVVCCAIGFACSGDNDVVSSVETTSATTNETAPATASSPPSTPTPSVQPIPTTSASVVQSLPPTTAGEGWARTDLGDRPPDGPVLASLLNGSPVVVYGLDGALVSAVLSEGRIVTAETPVVSSGMLIVSDMTVFGGSVLLTATEYAPEEGGSSTLRVWTSSDGLTWSDVVPSGLDPSAHLTALTATNDAVYAAGFLQESPSDPNLRPAMWRSTDGHQWEAITVPELGQHAIVGDLFAIGDSLIMVVGGATPRVLHSVDDGTTWVDSRISVNAAAWSVNSVARVGELLVAAGTAHAGTSRPLVLVSSDAGASWSAPADAIPIESDIPDVRLAATTGAFWLATVEFNSGFSNPEACYQDLVSCQGGAQAVLFRSTDGLIWDAVDLDAPGIGRIDSVTEHPGGGVVIVGSAQRSPRVEAWAWPSDAAPPAPPPTEAPDGGPSIVRFDSELTVGSTYRFPLYFHCGIGLLGNFNGRWWYLVPGSTVWGDGTGATGPPPADWPVAEQYIYGTITLIDEDTIEYTIPSGETIATYEASDVTPQLCA